MNAASKLRWKNVRKALQSLVGTKSHARKARSRFVHLEQLESRQLMAANLDTSGRLTVEGTSRADNITLVNFGGSIRIMLNGAPDTVNGVVRDLRVSEVNSITIRGYGGNDTLNATESPRGTTLDGGSGSDILYGSAFMDTLLAGDDLATETNHLFGFNGINLFVGGRGIDRMFGGNDIDIMDGGPGNDRLMGGEETMHCSAERAPIHFLVMRETTLFKAVEELIVSTAALVTSISRMPRLTKMQ